MHVMHTTADHRRLACPIALALALGISVTTCRLDKLINPATADRIVVNPDSVRASADSGSLDSVTTTVRVASADGVSLTWTATKTALWVTLSLSPDSLVVTLDPSTLSQGVHSDTIVVSSPQSKDTVRVPVVFTILPAAAHLVVSPTSRDTFALAGSAQPDTFSVRIKNKGALPLTWTAAPSATWITLSDSGGTVPPQDTTSTTVLVTLRPDTLSATTHNGRIVFSATGATGSPDTVPIVYRIDPCAETPIPTLDATRSGSIALSDCGAPQRAGRQAKLFGVRAGVGDTLTFGLTSAFNAYLILTDSAGTVVLDQNDQCPAALTACLTPFNVSTAGRYVIEVTSTNPAETGAFTLSAVKERAPSAPSAGQFRANGTTAIAWGGETPEDTVVFKALLSDPNPGDSVHLVAERVSLSGGTQIDSSAFVSVGSTATIRVGNLTEDEGYHWRSRTCDQTGRCSAWVEFGPNPQTAADFFVNTTPVAPVLTQLNQFRASDMTSIPEGGIAGATSATVVLTGFVVDPDPAEVIWLEVEVKPTGTAGPDSTGLARGAAGVATNGTASATLTFTGALLGGTNYYWRAHACDRTNRCSAWVNFGTGTPQSSQGGLGTPAATDFHVNP